MSKPSESWLDAVDGYSPGTMFKCKCGSCLMDVGALHEIETIRGTENNYSEVYVQMWQWGPGGSAWDNICHAFKTFWQVLTRGDVNGYSVCFGPERAREVAAAFLREAYWVEHGAYPEIEVE